MKPLAYLAAAAAIAGLATATASFAQDDHKGHHPDAAPKAEAAPKADPAPQQKGMGMGMMGPDHMKQMQEMCGNMMGKGMGNMAATGDNGPSSQAFAAANAKMHQAMTFAFTGDADVDFAKGMIAHHQGAIDMAKVALKYGKDDKIRKLAEDIIKAQEGEIAMMTGFLKAKGQ